MNTALWVFGFKPLDVNVWLRCDADITIYIVPVWRFILLHEHLLILFGLINVQTVKQVGISHFGFIAFVVQIYMRPLSENTSSQIKYSPYFSVPTACFRKSQFQVLNRMLSLIKGDVSKYISLNSTLCGIHPSNMSNTINVFVVVNFDALAQASDIRIEKRQVVFLCWKQDSNPSRSQTPNRQ